MTPTPTSKSTSTPMSAMPSRPTANKLNIWLVVSIILAVALIAVLAFYNMGDKEEMIIIPSEEAGDKLLNFINEVYGPQVGLATLKEVVEKSGLYEVSVTLTDQGQPVDQVVFITKDGEFFIPQALEIKEMLSQLEAWKQQQQAAPAAGLPVAPTPMPDDAPPADDEPTEE